MSHSLSGRFSLPASQLGLGVSLLRAAISCGRDPTSPTFATTTRWVRCAVYAPVSESTERRPMIHILRDPADAVHEFILKRAGSVPHIAERFDDAGEIGATLRR